MPTTTNSARPHERPYTPADRRRSFRITRSASAFGLGSPWEKLGGAIYGTPAVMLRPGGGLAVFVRGTNNVIYANYRGTGTGAGTWTGWSRLGGATLSSPTAISGYESGQLDVFVPGTAGGLYQNTYRGGAWLGWQKRDSTLPSTARLAAGVGPRRVIVYATANGETSYKQYVSRWVGYYPAPYACATCHPVSSSGAPAPR